MKFPIPDDWDGQSWCRWAVCWPDSEKWRGLLRGLVTLPSRGRTWDERTGSIIDVQSIGQEISTINLDLRRCIMACDDLGISEGLLAIASAMQEANDIARVGQDSQGVQCCEEVIINTGGGVQGSIPDIDLEIDFPFYGSQPPAGVQPGEFPPGYDDIEQYLVDKCEVANLIVDNAVVVIRSWQGFSFLNAAALVALLAASAFGIITFPPSILPIGAAWLILLAGSTFLFDQAADYIEVHREEFVCAMYDADGASAAVGVISELLSVLVTFLNVTGPLGVALKAILLIVFNSDVLNKLFTKTAHMVYPGADCSGCASDLTCFDFEAEQSLLGWVVTDQSGGSVDITVALSGMQVVTGNPSDTAHTVFSSPQVNYTIQAGDQFIILYTADPVPYGRTLWLTLDGVRTEVAHDGTIVDHLLCAPVDLTPHAGAVVSDIEVSINRFGGGTWVIRRAGFNCACL